MLATSHAITLSASRVFDSRFLDLISIFFNSFLSLSHSYPASFIFANKRSRCSFAEDNTHC